MKYFTIGPVEMYPEVCQAGGLQAEYFRDPEFAKKTIALQEKLLEIVSASASAQIAMLPGSGTTAMEAAVVNFTKQDDEVLVINAGSFGQRFVDLCQFHGRQTNPFQVEVGKNVNFRNLEAAITPNTRAVFATAHETSTGQKIDLKALGDFCAKRSLLLICDAVSALGADELRMDEWHINVLIFSANKGLGLAPGIGFLIADTQATDRMQPATVFTLDIQKYFDGAKRGQPPYTPPINVLMQLDAWIKRLEANGGLECEIQKVQENALYFRSGLSDLGLSSFPETPSNAITSFQITHGDSDSLYDYLKNDHKILINKSAYGFGIDLPRISHLGNLDTQDHKELLFAIQRYLEGS